MSKSRRSGARQYGDPRKRKPLAGDLQKLAQPTGIADPRAMRGGISGPGGPRDQGAVILDMTDVVLLGHIDVATVDAVRGGELGGQAIYLTMSGRINKKPDEVSIGFVFGPDGAAALITELLALADRHGAELLDDITRRFTDLHQGKNVDLHFLRAAIDNAMEPGD